MTRNSKHYRIAPNYYYYFFPLFSLSGQQEKQYWYLQWTKSRPWQSTIYSKQGLKNTENKKERESLRALGFLNFFFTEKRVSWGKIDTLLRPKSSLAFLFLSFILGVFVFPNFLGILYLSPSPLPFLITKKIK